MEEMNPVVYVCPFCEALMDQELLDISIKRQGCYNCGEPVEI